MKNKYNALYEHNKKLQDIIEPRLDKQIHAKSLKALLTCFAIGKAYKTHKAIMLLCENGYGQDAAILCRSLFDLMITIAYITKDPTDKRAERFQDYDWIIRKKMYQYAQNKPEAMKMIKEHSAHLKENENSIEEVLREADLAQSRYNYDPRYGWSIKSIRGMSEEVGRVEAYDTVYSLQSNLTHSAIRALNEYLQLDKKGGILVDTSESDTWVEETLVTTFDFFYHLIVAWDEECDLGLKESLDTISKEYVAEVDKINKKDARDA